MENGDKKVSDSSADDSPEKVVVPRSAKPKYFPHPAFVCWVLTTHKFKWGVFGYASCGTASNVRRLVVEFIRTTGVIITGARGTLRMHICGAYVHQPHEMFNGFPLYRKLHNPDHWLLMTTRKYWMVSTTYNKINNGASGFCHASGSKQTAALPSQVEKWFVYTKPRWQLQPSCQVTSYTACEWALELGRLNRADSDKAQEAMQTALSTAVGIHFTGAKGTRCMAINGLYELVPGVSYNYRPIYRKVAYPERWLLLDSCSHWTVCSTHAMRGNIRDGFCESVLLPSGDEEDSDLLDVDCAGHSDLLPTTISGWNVWNPIVKERERQHMVKVIGHSPSRWPTVRRTFLNDLHDARAQAAMRAKSQLCGLLIEGAQGPHAGLINGHFELEGEMHGQVCFRKVLDPDRWLGCNYDGRWMVCDSDEKRNCRSLVGWCQGFCDDVTKATTVLSPLSMTKWGSWVNKKFVWQKGMRLTGFESAQWSAIKERVQRAEEEAVAQRMALAAERAVGVRVSGACGMSSSCINGHYKLCNESLCGHPLYQKVLDEDKWLRFCPAGVWIASNTVSKNLNESRGVRTYAQSLGGGALPSEATAWVDRKLCPQPGLRVECFSKAEWLSQSESLETTAKSEKLTALSDAAAIASGHTAPSLGCPHGGIQEFKTPNGGFYCDVCGSAQELGSVMFGCRKCDYDQCLQCHSEAMAWGSRVDALFDVFDLDEDSYLCKQEYRGYLRVVAADASVLDDAQWDRRWAALATEQDFLLTIGMSRAKFRRVYREGGARLEEHERRCGLKR